MPRDDVLAIEAALERVAKQAKDPYRNGPPTSVTALLDEAFGRRPWRFGSRT